MLWFSSSHVWMWELDHKESWALKNWCFWTVVLEKTLESPLDCKEIKPVNVKRKWVLNIHWKDWCWSSNTLATWCEELTHWKRPRHWERLKAGGEWGDRGWDGWMASWTQWTWVWASSRSWWWTGKHDVLQSMGLQRTGHDWGTEQNNNIPLCVCIYIYIQTIYTFIYIYTHTYHIHIIYIYTHIFFSHILTSVNDAAKTFIFLN